MRCRGGVSASCGGRPSALGLWSACAISCVMRTAHRPLTRHLWTLLGAVSVALGLIGLALPILPTTPFMILAAFAFSKSSPRLEAWLLTHPRFGPAIRNWRETGAIHRSHKRLALAMMAAAFGLSVILALPAHVLAIQLVCLGGAALFILTRPDAP